MDSEQINLKVRASFGGLLGKSLGVVAVLFILGVVGLTLFRMIFVNFVDNYELAYVYDKRSGTTTILADTITTRDSSGVSMRLVYRTGYIVSAPVLVKVHSVDLRPMQVCINANARVLNCKLVRFNPAGLSIFLEWHGRDDYEGGASCIDGDTHCSTSNLNRILMSYAYDGSGKTYPFLEVMRELKPEEVVQP